MNRISIGYFADGPWAHSAFEKIVQDPSLTIKFIVPRADSVDNTLMQYAKKYNIPFHKGIKINSDDFYEIAIPYECDLFVSMSFNQIFRNKIINLPKLGTINCHAGKLPFYKGRNILNWALINDENEFGITVHFIDEGIDTGDIILQRTFPIRETDNYKTLLETAFKQCAEILYDSIKLLQTDKVSTIKQSEIHPIGFYCGQRYEGDEIVNWQQSSRELFNFIRALCDPGPRATTTLKGEIIRINKAQIIPNAPSYKCIAGQVVGKTPHSYVVKTSDTTIEISEIEAEIKLRIGDRLGT